MSRTQRLLIVLALNLALVAALVAVGVTALPWRSSQQAVTISSMPRAWA
jgi:hypothetical protein